MRDRPVKLVGGIGEQLDTVPDQIIRDRVERDAGSLELGEDAPGVLDIFVKTGARVAMVAEGRERRRRRGIEGLGADQLLGIEHVAIVFVLCTGRGPQQALRPGALGLELLPARSGEEMLVFLIGEFCIRDGDLALNGASRSFSVGSLPFAIFSAGSFSAPGAVRPAEELGTVPALEGS